ncbi:extracellular solute-binding protein, partial [Brachybacterium muris]
MNEHTDRTIHTDHTAPASRAGAGAGPGLSRRRLLTGSAALAPSVAGVGTLAACGGASATGDGVELDYWLWDALQLPAYSAAIDLFMEKNPDITVRITQMGWGDYWTKLTASFVAEAGPDAFTDHLARFPEFLRLGVIAPLDGLGPIDELEADRFQEGLQELWTGQDGKRYGVPKDYDTIAILYDKGLLDAEGLSPEDLEGLEWNPEDGGTFEQMLARLTVDTNGVRGDEDGFDPTSVARYGLAADPAVDYTGQTSWSPFALSTGWTFTDKDTWGTRFQYDDERFAAAIDWYFGLVDKGFLPVRDVRRLQPGPGADPGRHLGTGHRGVVHDHHFQQPRWRGAGHRAAAGRARGSPRLDVQRAGRFDLDAVGEEGGGGTAGRVLGLGRGPAADRRTGPVLPGDGRRHRGCDRPVRRDGSGRDAVHRPGRQRGDGPVPAGGELRVDRADHADRLRPGLDAADRRGGLRLVQRPGQRPVRLTAAGAAP